MNILKSNYFLTSSLLINLTLFLIITISIGFEASFIHIIDINSFLWLHTLLGESNISYISDISFFYIYIIFLSIITISTLIIFSFKCNLVFLVWNVFTIITGIFVGSILKYLFHNFVIDTALLFPSSHSLLSTLIIFSLMLSLSSCLKNNIFMITIFIFHIFIWISLIFYSLYFQANFLSEVLGGITFSFSWLILSYLLFKKYLLNSLIK